MTEVIRDRATHERGHQWVRRGVAMFIGAAAVTGATLVAAAVTRVPEILTTAATLTTSALLIGGVCAYGFGSSLKQLHKEGAAS